MTELHGLPGPLTPWLLTVAQIYVRRVLELAKTGEHRVRASQPHVEGEALGVPLLGFELEVALART